MEREKFLSSVYIVLRQENKILLQRRAGTKIYNGFLAMPAGHIDEGENCYEAVIREAKEELGIDITKEDIKDTYVVQRRSKMHGPYYDVYFEIKNWNGEIKIMEPNKCTEILWVDENELPEDMIKFERDALEMYKNGIKFDCIDVLREE